MASGGTRMKVHGHGQHEPHQGTAPAAQQTRPPWMSQGSDGHRRYAGFASGPPPKFPPNLSGDPAGYNTVRFPSAKKVKDGVHGLGYTVAYNFKKAVAQFQSDYNIVHKHMPKKAPGTLTIDGVPGVHTLNGMDWATRIAKTMPKSWIYYVKKSRTIDGGNKPKPKPKARTRKSRTSRTTRRARRTVSRFRR